MMWVGMRAVYKLMGNRKGYSSRTGSELMHG